MSEKSTTSLVEPGLFYEDELVGTLKEVTGPLNGFKIDAELKKKYQQDAVADGSVEGMDFADCVIFHEHGDKAITQKNKRHEAKRGQEILKLLQDIAETSDPKTPEALAQLGHAQARVTTAALIESCRRLRVEPGATVHHIKLYEDCLNEAQQELYHKPDEKIAKGIAGTLAKNIRHIEADNMPSSALQFVDSFKQDYPWLLEIKHQTVSENLLSDERIAEFHNELKRRYQHYFEKLRHRYPEISNEILPEVTNAYLNLRGFRESNPESGEVNGWNCVYSEELTGYRVDPSVKQVLCGIRNVEITWERFEELMIHEIEGHLIRADNSQKKNLPYLVTGLQKSEEAVEGSNILNEQLWRGKLDYSLQRDHFRYITAAYAEGVMDGQKHGQQDVYDFVSRFMAVNSILNAARGGEVDTESKVKTARKAAFEHTYRAYRGMPPGFVFWKDTVYLYGKLQSAKFLQETEASASDIIDFMQQGNFNPADHEHLKIIQGSGLQVL